MQAARSICMKMYKLLTTHHDAKCTNFKFRQFVRMNLCQIQDRSLNHHNQHAKKSTAI